ncbi:type IV secretion system protein TraC [Rugamonas sp. A1-17]|nr:type IV secretion system protein TraC [Rugamonas sp. A1-17]
MNMNAALKTLFSPLRDMFGPQEEQPYQPTPLRAMREITNTESFRSILPHCAYDEVDGLFVLDTGERDPKGRSDALGMVIELTPQTGATEEMINVLAPIIAGAPGGTFMQFSLYGGSRIIDRMKLFALLRDTDDLESQGDGDRRSKGLFRAMARRRIEYYLRGTAKRLVPHIPFLVRDFRLVLSISRHCDPRDVKVIEELVRMRDGVHATLKAASFDCWNWSPTDLINWCYELTNPNKLLTRSAHYKKTYDPGRLIRHQIVDQDTVCTPTNDGKSLRYGLPGEASEVHSRLYSVTGYPKDFPLWGMGNLIGDYYHGQLGYPCPFVITMGIQVLEQADHKNVAQIKGARATTNASSPMARFLPEFQDKKRDWDTVNRSYAAGMGEVDMYHQVLLMAPPAEIEAAETATRSIWRARGFNLVPMQYMQVPGILTSLPLGYTPTMQKFYKRKGLSCRKTSLNAVNLAPMIAEWKGTATPVLNLIGRRGQLMSIDLFDNKGGNYNFSCAASSGSGKSVLANEIASSYLGVGAKIFIIDVGRSYEKICRRYDGEYIEFVKRPDFRICVNPFDNIVDILEDMEMIKPLVAQMASPSGTLTDHDRSLIEIAIVDKWTEMGNLMEITDVAEALKKSKDRDARRLGDQLFPYTREGMYGMYFTGKSNVDFSKDLVVLELEELNSKKDLQSVILFIMMFRITQAMYHDRRDRKKICIIDEAWDLMDGANSGKFIEVGYRRARKYGGAFGTLTQSVMDYYKNPASQAALENSDWLFLLKQKKESIEQLDRGGKLKLDEATKRILLSVKTEQGLYSEIYINSPMGAGIGRLIVDPFTLLAYSTDPLDWNAIQRYRDQGLGVTDAINAVLQEREERAGSPA